MHVFGNSYIPMSNKILCGGETVPHVKV